MEHTLVKGWKTKLISTFSILHPWIRNLQKCLSFIYMPASLFMYNGTPNLTVKHYHDRCDCCAWTPVPVGRYIGILQSDPSHTSPHHRWSDSGYRWWFLEKKKQGLSLQVKVYVRQIKSVVKFIYLYMNEILLNNNGSATVEIKTKTKRSFKTIL